MGIFTKVLNRAVKRNVDQFSDDFMFHLHVAEKTEAVTNCDHLANFEKICVTCFSGNNSRCPHLIASL